MNSAHDKDQVNIDNNIESAIVDAMELVNYAAKMGLKVKQETLDTLVKAKSTWEKRKWTPKAEASFWGAFNQISRDIKPDVSRLYTAWTLIVLFTVLFFQIYWLIGNHLSTKLTELLANEIELENAERQAKLDYDLIKIRFELLEAESIDSKASIDLYNTPEWKRETAELDVHRQKIDDDLEDLRAKLARNSQILLDWATPWQNLFSLLRDNENSPNTADQEQAITSESQSEASDKGFKEAQNKSREQVQETTIEAARKVRVSAELVLIALQGYLLPVLYGLLGASVYVLRTLERQTATVMLPPENSRLLRLGLGTIAGLIIGWFVSLFPNQALSIPSSALAFLAGYNIEFLFKQMDKVIKQSGPENGAANGATTNGTTTNEK